MEYFGALNMLSGTMLKERIAFAIEATSLQSHTKKKINELSGGLKRRVNLAVGLLNDPKILYLDEPTVGVDPHSRSYILSIIKKLNKELGLTVIYTSHYMDEVEEISDDIVIIDRGEMVLHGTKESIVGEGKKLGGVKSPLEELFLSLASNTEERV
jgi:ABC-2 type transport system ATP-binding protein